MARVICNAGKRYKPVYVPSVDEKTGRVGLIETNVVDVYAQIQSFKDSVDINCLIQRFKNGELDVLNQRQGFYADVTEFPKTYAEMHALMQRARNSFDALPVDMRKQFDFDFNVYLASLGQIVPEKVADAAPAAAPVESSKEEGKSE